MTLDRYRNKPDRIKALHSVTDKEEWIEVHDATSLFDDWCIVRKIPLNVTEENLKKFSNLSIYEKEIERLWPIKSGKALEVGCMWGRFVFYKLLNFDMEIHAVDASRVSPEHAVKIANNLNLKNIKFYTMIAEDLEFSDNEFDVIYSFETLEHVIDLDKSLSEMARVLHPDGCLIFSLPLEHNHDGGTHTQTHTKVFWLKKFSEYFAIDAIENFDFRPNGDHRRIIGKLSKKGV
jgi:ubiquinone/menaquinone biosynthesis C-methylase UbiE